MTTAYATSDDGFEWQWHGTVLKPRAGKWDARGARLTAVLPDGRAAYDGRATKEENWFERTGLARHTGNGRLEQLGDDAVADVRYLDVLVLPAGGYRIYYEARLQDESHELRTELIRLQIPQAKPGSVTGGGAPEECSHERSISSNRSVCTPIQTMPRTFTGVSSSQLPQDRVSPPRRLYPGPSRSLKPASAATKVFCGTTAAAGS